MKKYHIVIRHHTDKKVSFVSGTDGIENEQQANNLYKETLTLSRENKQHISDTIYLYYGSFYYEEDIVQQDII